MEAKAKFKIIYSEETIQFLNSLDVKTKAKIMYNINKSKYVIDKELFKKLDDADDIWEFEKPYIAGLPIGCLLLGHREGDSGHYYSWYNQKDPENSTKRNS